jgi:hypothetical protein
MDTKEDSLKHATKMLQGKTHRSSGQPIQKTLSDKVMMEEILNNPELMELYQDHQMTERPYLPEQQEFVAYLRSQTTMKELAEKTDLKKTTIEHWFRKDKAGFSHPSIEDWEAIKPHLKELKYDKELTTIKSIEWENQKMWPTPRANNGNENYETSNKRMEKRKKEGRVTGGVRNLATEVQEEQQKMWPTPAARDHKDTGENTDYEKLARKSKLSGAVKSKMFLTPGANEDAAGKPTDKMQRMLGNSPEVRNTGKGTLNPDWVEWMMGYPPGWTDIKDS